MPQVTPPQEFFGFPPGSDRQLARWDRIVDYFNRLATESACIRVQELGKTAEGNPFILAIISSERNLQDLEYWRRVNLKISDPRGRDDLEVATLVDSGRAVICQSMSLHANEVGGTQMALELAYELLARDDEDTQHILDNVIFLMIPCFNPDGQLMIVDWYQRYLDTAYEGSPLPWLYHKYAGHDNNRDAFMQNLPESRYMASILFREWIPQVYQDHHHMGSYGARLYVAPYCDPLHPHADPLIWREHAWFGSHMATLLEQEGKQGILNAAQFEGWGHLGFHWLTAYHNIAGMLTESASCQLATPLYIHPDQLEGACPRTMPVYAPQTNFPHPWPGGWWRLRDIVEQQKIAAWALLDFAARHRQGLLQNAAIKARRQTQRGVTESPYAYAICPDQHDPLTVAKLVEVLLQQGIELHVALEDFTCGPTYPRGTYLVFLAQPKWGVIQTLLGTTLYPDQHWTRAPDGTPRVRDMATDTVAEFMGVRVDPLGKRIRGSFQPITRPYLATRPWRAAAGGYLLQGRYNDSYRLVNRLLAAGFPVYRLTAPWTDGQCSCACGDFYLPYAATLEQFWAESARPPVWDTLEQAPDAPMQELQAARLGLYQRYWGGNMDEGWTRLVLEQFAFSYRTFGDAPFRGDRLREECDVLILPQDKLSLMTGQPGKDDRYLLQLLRSQPPEFHSGWGEEGMRALASFVHQGGRLVALDSSAEVARVALDLMVEDVTADLSPNEYYCKGSTLWLELDPQDPLAYGMPQKALAVNWNSPAFRITETVRPADYHVVARYPRARLLESGWLIGEERLQGKSAVLRIRQGEGEVALLGCRVQHRAQTHGTYKLLFNALYR